MQMGFSMSGRSRQILFGAICTTVILTGIMSYLVYTGNKMVTKFAPLVDAAMEIKLEATLAHLWFEEIIAGDHYEDINTVWRHIDASTNYATLMLDGGETTEGVFLALDDPLMRREIETVRVKLGEFRLIADKRYEARQQSSAGSKIDQQFDMVFEDVMRQADQVETMLKRSIDSTLSGFRHTAFFLIGATIILGVALSWGLHRLFLRREESLRSLAHANTLIQRQNDSLNSLAHYDTLTGLPNRSLFFDRLRLALSHAERNKQQVVLLYIDMDQFKSVNDSMGHPVGDLLLKGFGQRLQQCVRAEDTVARLAGDEYTMILPYQASTENATRAATEVATKIRGALEAPFRLGQGEMVVSCSIGIAVFPQDGHEPEELLNHADTAMYYAKQHGKNGYEFFSSQMSEDVKRRLEIEAGLREALKQDQLVLHYQPQFDTKTRALRGGEALLRWEHPEQGMISPGEFIPVAEASGLIVPIGTWVLRTVCQQFRTWLDAGLDPGILSINVSPHQFVQKDFVATVEDAIASAGIQASQIEVEITETTLMVDAKQATDVLLELKRVGVKLAIDDFGTGYSSMAYLRNFPIDTLKIDRVFVIGIEKGEDDRAILDSMVSLAHNLNLEIVAEGVETDEQLSYLSKLKSEFIQGFIFGRPQPIDEFAKLCSPIAGNSGSEKDKPNRPRLAWKR
jgi:diguanylate cyclase (GGDEF)-like protein